MKRPPAIQPPEPISLVDGEDDLHDYLNSLLSCPPPPSPLVSPSLSTGCSVPTPSDLLMMREEEQEALRAIFDNDFEALGTQVFRIRIRPLALESSAEQVSKLFVSFITPDEYPFVPAIFEFVEIGSEASPLTGAQADEIWSRMMKEAKKRTGSPMIYEIVTMATEHLAQILSPKILPMKEKVIEEEEEEEEEEVQERVVYYRGNPIKFTGPVSDIVSQLPSYLRVTNIENVLRPSLVRRFEDESLRLSYAYPTKQSDPIAWNLGDPSKPKLGFHGTLPERIGSIVRKGLVVPGTDGVATRHDIGYYGAGIYLSPESELSLSYSQGGRLLVCAVLMGKAYRCRDLMMGASCKAGFDSHIGGGGREWVLFKACQVLPCWVIHFGEGLRKNRFEPKKVIPPMRKNATQVLETRLLRARASDLDAKEKKMRQEILTAHAKRYLPFGYGMQGDRFVVEDRAPVSDDEDDIMEAAYQEEDEYQEFRF